MAVKCVWCGRVIEEVQGLATMDTCDSCEDFFEDNIDEISKVLNELLLKNEDSALLSNLDNKKKAWISYSLITAIHMLSSRPSVEFKDSNFNKHL